MQLKSKEYDTETIQFINEESAKLIKEKLKKGFIII